MSRRTWPGVSPASGASPAGDATDGACRGGAFWARRGLWKGGSRLAVVLLGMLAVTAGSTVADSPAGSVATGAPNPYGPDSADITVTVGADGTLAVEETVRWELYESGVDVQGGSVSYDPGGTVHMGFQLPSTDDFPIRPYLRPAWTDPIVSVRDQNDRNGDDRSEGRGNGDRGNGDSRVKAKVERVGHALVLDASASYGAGEYTARTTYRITGAARQAGNIVEIYFRPLTGVDVESLTVKGPGLTAARCVKIPPESRPCGTTTEDGDMVIKPTRAGRWGRAGNRSAEIIVEAAPKAYNLAPPVIDRG